jgi:hypothetical protein
MTLIESCRIEYNTERPHSSLGYLTPEQFARAHEATQQSLTLESNCGPDQNRGRVRPDLVEPKAGSVKHSVSNLKNLQMTLTTRKLKSDIVNATDAGP